MASSSSPVPFGCSEAAASVQFEDIPELSGELARLSITGAAKGKKLVIMEIKDDSLESEVVHRILKEAAFEFDSNQVTFSIKLNQTNQYQLGNKFWQQQPGVMIIRENCMVSWIDAQQIVTGTSDDLVRSINNLDI